MPFGGVEKFWACMTGFWVKNKFFELKTLDSYFGIRLFLIFWCYESTILVLKNTGIGIIRVLF